MLSELLTTPITITTRTPSGEKDGYGNAVDAETTIEVLGELQQRQRGEDAESIDIADSRWLLVLPASTVISADSAITVAGRDYEVDGEPWPVHDPIDQTTSHIEATVRRVAGADTP